MAMFDNPAIREAAFGPSTAPAVPKVVHLKGFAKGLDFKDVNTLVGVRAVVQRLNGYYDQGYTVLAWDGDAIKDGSFAYLLSGKLAGGAAIDIPKLKPFALRSYHLQEDHKGWTTMPSWATATEKVALNIPNNPDGKAPWDKLGVEGMKRTLETQKRLPVVCLGGGDTLKAEIAASPAKAQFFVAPVSRKVNNVRETTKQFLGRKDTGKLIYLTTGAGLTAKEYGRWKVAQARDAGAQIADFVTSLVDRVRKRLSGRK